MKILVGAFEPCGGHVINPAREAVRLLPHTIGGAAIERVELPVAFGRDTDVLERAIAQSRPDVCLCVGQAGGRPRVTPEFVGINYERARIPDNAGTQPSGIPVVPDGPAAYFSTVPVHAIGARMQAEGIPAAVAYSAGTFCCNEVLYAALHLAATRYPGMRAGFIHVPYAAEQVEHAREKAPSMSIETMARALSIAVRTCVDIHQGDIVATRSGTES